MKGMITDVQKFSLHDGPGIRTTIFMKGCDFRCIWCHNPETLIMERQNAFYKDKCIACGHCKDGCPTGARKLIGYERTIDELFNEIFSDIPYYISSGGGVTISGGEPLMQSEFVTALLRTCKEVGINTAIETNLSFPYHHLAMMLPYIDLIFYDLKVFDDTLHQKVTSVSNKNVLENSKRLADDGYQAVVRTPLIPGITDSDTNIAAISDWLKKLGNISYYEILNYNSFAKAKYEPLGMEYELPDAKPLSPGRIRELAAIAQQRGINVCFGQE